MPDRSVAGALSRPADIEPLLSRLLDQQVSCWQEGNRVLVEAFLQEHPSLRSCPEAVLDLLYREKLLREEQGETPSKAEYLSRFPDLAEQLDMLFEVDAVFDHPSWVQRPPRPQPLPETVSPPEAQPPPESTVVETTHDHRIPPPVAADLPGGIPGYEILGELGRGGMGVVFKARQRGLKRLVALKMIRGGGPGAEELERFGREAEAVARLQHPNIVQIYEIGSHNGQPYFSLEYVEGGSLDRKLAGNPLPPLAAARLVQTLACAVQAAHDRGILHRDLKPANILLTAPTTTPGAAVVPAGEPSLGVPKITDFGLAKRLDVDVGQTQSGAVMGTPSYMAPEQAQGRIHDLGPAADVYALGAILYELLTGRPPFRGATLLDTLQQVVSREPVSPRSLQPTVKRDLETICLKCLRKEPGKRYPSAQALADDLHRFLTGQPIQARPVGVVERTLKLAGRHRLAASLVVFSTLMLIGTVVGLLLAYASVNNALEDKVRALADKSQALTEKTQTLTEKTQALTEKGVALASSEFTLKQAVLAIDSLLAEVAEIEWADVPRTEQNREKLLVKASAIYQGLLEKRGDDPVVQQNTGRINSRRGDILALLDKYADAEKAYKEAVTLLRQRVAEAPTETAAREELAHTLNQQGILFKKLNRAEEAKGSFGEALQIRQKLADSSPGPDHSQDLAETHYFFGALLATLAGQEQDAHAHYLAASSIQKKLVAGDPRRPEYQRDLARTYNNWAILYWNRARNEARLDFQADALRLSQETADQWQRLNKDYPDVANYRFYLAAALNNRGGNRAPTNPKEAINSFTQAREILAGLVTDFPKIPRYRQEQASVLGNLGRLWNATKQFALAETALREARKLRQKLATDFPKNYDYLYLQAKTSQELGAVLHRNAQYQEAEGAYRDSLAALEELVKQFEKRLDYRADLIVVLNNLAKLLRERGNPHEPRLVARLVLPSLPGKVLVDLGPLAQMHGTHYPALREAEQLLDRAIKLHRANFKHQQVPSRSAKTIVSVASSKFLAELYFLLADTCLLLGQDEGAEQAAMHMPEVDPGNPEEYVRVAQIFAGIPPRDGSKDYHPLAVQLLQQAAAQGFLKFHHLNNPRYQPLRKREDFKQLQKNLAPPTGNAPA